MHTDGWNAWLVGQGNGSQKASEEPVPGTRGSFEFVTDLPDPTEGTSSPPGTTERGNKDPTIIEVPDTEDKSDVGQLPSIVTPRSSSKSEQTKSPDFKSTSKSGKAEKKGKAKAEKTFKGKSTPADVCIPESSPDTCSKRGKLTAAKSKKIKSAIKSGTEDGSALKQDINKTA